MPRGPKGQKRPADVIGNAVRVMQIATGEREEELEAVPEKDPAASALGKKGGGRLEYPVVNDGLGRVGGGGPAEAGQAQTLQAARGGFDFKLRHYLFTPAASQPSDGRDARRREADTDAA